MDDLGNNSFCIWEKGYCEEGSVTCGGEKTEMQFAISSTIIRTVEITPEKRMKSHFLPEINDKMRKKR